LECRIDNNKTLEIPFYSEIETLQQILSQHEHDDDNDDNDNDDDRNHHRQVLSNLVEDSRHIAQQVLYAYDDNCSASFLAMALALRYKCPIVITSQALEMIDQFQCILEDIDGAASSVCIQQHIHDNDGDGDDVNKRDSNSNNNIDDDEAIRAILPQWRSTSALQSQSQRVVGNIEQGFQLTKLQGALKIALEKGDDAAAVKIRAAMDKLMGDE
jgi:hypothetical protein